MTSIALMGCLIFSASDAMAQGRSRSQGGSTSSRSQSAAVSRSHNSAAPSVSRSSSSSATSRSSATPQVNRSSSATSRSSATPQVNRSSSATSRNNDSGTRVGRGATTRGTSDRGSATAPPTTTRHTDVAKPSHIDKGTRSDRSSTVGITTTPSDNRQHVTPPSGGTKPGGTKGGIDKPNGNRDRNGKPNGGNKPGGNKGGMDRPNGNNGHMGGKPGNNRHDDRFGGNHGYNDKHRYDYKGHHYRDQFSWNYRNHNWTRPLPPPVRVHRPAPWVWYRPVIPTGWRPYPSAPVIDRILGIVFGTLYYDSLNHLYCNGYYIDGYADDVIYLRDVPMLGLYWSDAMLNYSNNRFANAQFVYYSNRYDDARYNIIINKLSRIYGAPVCRDGVSVSWYGSDAVGFVTLSMMNDSSGYYTTLSIGY